MGVVVPKRNLSAVTDRHPSPAVWSWFDNQYADAVPGKFFHFFDDFKGQCGAAESSTSFSWVGGSPPILYNAFGTGSTTVAASRTAADEEIGVLSLDADASGDEIYLKPDATYTNPFGRISDTSGDKFPQAFEARIRIAKLDDNVAWLAGIHEAVAAATDTLADSTGALADNKDFIGFRALEADPDGLDAVYKESTTETVVKEAASGVSGQTAEADTWVKLGIRFDGTSTWWFVNNELVNRNAGVEPDADDFPDATVMNFIIGVKTFDAGDFHLDVDWIRYARAMESVEA